jgi:hypothetical protein
VVLTAFQNGEDSHPERLSGLRQAMYVLSQIQSGTTLDSIVRACDDDRQVIDIWITFLKERDWIVRDVSTDRWALTEKGKTQAKNYFLV